MNFKSLKCALFELSMRTYEGKTMLFATNLYTYVGLRLTELKGNPNYTINILLEL